MEALPPYKQPNKYRCYLYRYIPVSISLRVVAASQVDCEINTGSTKTDNRGCAFVSTSLVPDDFCHLPWYLYGHFQSRDSPPFRPVYSVRLSGIVLEVHGCTIMKMAATILFDVIGELCGRRYVEILGMPALVGFLGLSEFHCFLICGCISADISADPR